MFYKVTSREREVLRFLMIGKSNKYIASELGISPFTVRDHVSSLLSKFKVPNRIELVVILNSQSFYTNTLHLTD